MILEVSRREGGKWKGMTRGVTLDVVLFELLFVVERTCSLAQDEGRGGGSDVSSVLYNYGEIQTGHQRNAPLDDDSL